jgi:predicted small lipoprotein YifL
MPPDGIIVFFTVWKHSMLPLTTAARIALLIFPLLLTGCGQMGPLFQPEEPMPTPDVATDVAAPLLDPNAP